MKKLNYLFYLLALPAMAFLASCGGDDEPTPDTAPSAKVVTTIMTTDNGGNTGDAIVTTKVTTADGTVKLRLDIRSQDDIDQIFILRSQDNGTFTPVIKPELTDITNTYGTFSAGTNESFSVPGSTKTFILDIPLKVRSTGSPVSDVYQIWLTKKGALTKGDFTKPTKNLVLGSSYVTLNYTNAALITYSSATLDVGTQSAKFASFLVTSGKVSVLSTADYNDAPGSADIRFVSLDGSGKKNNTATNLVMYSPADIETANPSSDATTAFTATAGSRITTFATYTAKSFDQVTGVDLFGINASTITSKSIVVTEGGVYSFSTADGRVGVIKINTITTDNDATFAGGLNANVSIKVLNK